MFVWGSKVYMDGETPPQGAENIYVIGKQWMWKIQHPEGRREINELHVPVDTAIKLTLTSQDVIHSFYLPSFRIKQDALPGQYRTIWFQADRPGTYHMFCAEYCGTDHSKMIGSVVRHGSGTNIRTGSPARTTCSLLRRALNYLPSTTASTVMAPASGCVVQLWAVCTARM